MGGHGPYDLRVSVPPELQPAWRVLILAVAAGCTTSGAAPSGHAPRGDGGSDSAHPRPNDAGAHASDAGAQPRDSGAADSSVLKDAAPTDASLPPDGPSLDAGPPVDAPYPAFSLGARAPQVTNNGAPVLASALFVPIMFAGDSLTSQIDVFVSAVGPSDYWATIGSEYGVGPATSSPVIVEEMSSPGTNVTDAEVQQFLAVSIATDPRFGALGLPADAGVQTSNPSAVPPAEAVYVVFYPTGTTISAGALGESCEAFGGYHSSFALGNGAKVAYAVIPRCASFNGLTGKDFVTSATSHELIEAATDPDPYVPAYQGTDGDHFVWTLVLGDGEVADLCASLLDANVHPTEASLSSFLVQRSWSNQGAQAGQDPCVPTAGEPSYFNTLPTTTQISFVDQGQSYQTLGTQVAVGQTATVTLDLASSGPTAGPWTVDLEDYGEAFGGSEVLGLKLLGRSSGSNGQTLTLQITAVQAASPSLFGIAPYFVYSKLGTVSTMWVGAVTN